VAGQLVSIHIARGPAEPMVEVHEVRAVETMGLEGDRYYFRTGTFARHWKRDAEVTFIEIEAIEALARDYEVTLAPGEARRNLITRGVALNHLVGRRFRVGEVVFLGHGLCEPCRHLERVTQLKIEDPLRHRGGLRAQIQRGGVLRAGDVVTLDA
jgi:MOSC domain-containing protein YiiM